MNRHPLAAAALAAALLAVPRPALALFGAGDVVWDPAADVKNAAKVTAMLQELAEMKRQLDQLRREIQSLGSPVADPGGDAFGRAGAALEGATNLRHTLDDWKARLPIDVKPDDVPRGGLPEHQAELRRYLTERTAAVDSALKQIEQQRRQTTEQVAAVVSASNGAAGPTAAQQATNDLHAIVAAEQARLEALRALRHRLDTDAEAARQAGRAAVDADLDRDRGEAQFLINHADTGGH